MIQIDKQIACALVGAAPGLPDGLTILGVGQLNRLPESSHRQLGLLTASACGDSEGIDALFV